MLHTFTDCKTSDELNTHEYSSLFYHSCLEEKRWDHVGQGPYVSDWSIVGNTGGK